MNNQQLAHRFFYQDAEGTKGNYSNMSLSFEGNTIYSYSTAIGEIREDKNGNNILLLSDNNMSNTTGKHISYIRQACPFDYESIIYVPQKYGSSYFSDNETIAQKMINLLLSYEVADFTKQEHRERYTHIYNMLSRFLNKIDVDLKIDDELTKLYDVANNKEKLREFKKANSIKQQEKNRIIKKELLEFIKGKSSKELYEVAFKTPFLNTASLSIDCQLALQKYIIKNCIDDIFVNWSDKCQNVFEYNSQLDRELKSVLKKDMLKNNISIVYWLGDYLKTSQNITIEKDKIKPLLKLWQAGKLRHGMKIEHYKVMSVTSEIVKVGCHNIKVSNLLELIKELAEV